MQSNKPKPGSEKIQKILARRGLGSRREMEEWIEDGRVTINNRTAQLGDRAMPEDRLTVDGRKLKILEHEPSVKVLLYHKPVGEICTRDDPEGRPTVFENLPTLKGERWVNIGRLDINTSGLLLFTNSGDLANKLMHPSFSHEREYAVRIFGEVDDDAAKQLVKGIKLEDGMARFEHIMSKESGHGANHWYHVVIMHGRNRVVRRLFEAVDVTVSRLIRVRFGRIVLPSAIREGQFKELKAREIEKLTQDLNERH